MMKLFELKSGLKGFHYKKEISKKKKKKKKNPEILILAEQK